MHSFIYAVLAMTLVPLAAPQPVRAQDDPTIYMVSYIDVAPAAKSQAAALLRALAEPSRKEADSLRFQILQRTAPAHQFVILEIWKDQRALDGHAAAPHTKEFHNRISNLLIAPVDDRLCIATHVGTLVPDAGRGALHVVTHVDVPNVQRDKVLPALGTLAERSRRDPGNLRFDVVHQKARANHFTVMEVWKDQKSNAAHELAAHTREFRNLLTPITGALYDQRWYKAM